MRALGFAIIAMASLADMMSPAAAGPGDMPKSPGIATEAPQPNSLQALTKRLFWLESQGKIDPEDADNQFNEAVKNASPDELKAWSRHIDEITRQKRK